MQQHGKQLKIMKIQIELDNTTAFILAQSKGWAATIEDTSQELDGDEFPQIANPVPIESYLASICEQFISEYVLVEIRNSTINNISSLHDKIQKAIINKRFDDSLKNGDNSSLFAFIDEELGKFKN